MAVRIASPLYEDGPWLKDPIKPDMFRNLPSPRKSRELLLPQQKSKRGGTLRSDTVPSITSVHKKGSK